MFTQNADFNYREPYFLEVNTLEFSKKHKTHRLDDEWGIWGHNLSKIIKKTTHSDNIYALINGKRNKKQFCFSSTEIEKTILDETQNTNKTKFVIAPQDNQLVCECEKCKSVGNTKKEASPAVFSLLKKLALLKPKLNFYTLIYPPITKTPNFSLPKNVGVFYSTINYQKGIPYENQKNITHLKKELSLWKEKINKLFIWDYALNFDNYFDFYPNLSVIQQNLSFFKSIGVNGIFFNGSENYAVFQELKTLVLAKLLWDINIDIQQEISTYFQKNYPKEIAEIIIPYYLGIEHDFLTSEKQQGIYSNIKEAQHKYLDTKRFLSFFDEITTAYANLNYKHENTSKLLVALSFLKLEIIRTTDTNSLPKSTKKDIIDLLSLVNKEATKNEISFINEHKEELKTYTKEWYQQLLKPTTTNLLINKKLQIISNLDEDYKDTSILNDNNFGFLNYNTNWFIISKDDLKINFNKNDIIEGNEFVFSFLNDPKHHIYFPESISIISSETVLFKQNIASSSKNEKRVISIPLYTKILTDSIVIKIKRKTMIMKSAIACDEIILKN